MLWAPRLVSTPEVSPLWDGCVLFRACGMPTLVMPHAVCAFHCTLRKRAFRSICGEAGCTPQE